MQSFDGNDLNRIKVQKRLSQNSSKGKIVKKIVSDPKLKAQRTSNMTPTKTDSKTNNLETEPAWMRDTIENMSISSSEASEGEE